MEKKKSAVIILISLALLFDITALILVAFNFYTTGVILYSIGIICLFIGFYLKETVANYELTQDSGFHLEPVEEDEESIINRKIQYQHYLNEKSADLVEAFSILSDKRTNKKTKAKRIKKYIEKGLL